MTYEPKILEGMTVDEINHEIDQWIWNEYAYSRLIDWCRMWDLEATRKKLLLEQQ